jgi:Tol biopolymer transport system component
VDLPGLNADATSALPSVTAGGRRLAFTRIVYNTASRDKPNPSHVLIYDREKSAFITPGSLNAPGSQHKFGAISGDGSVVAFVSSQFPMMHQESIRLFDLRARMDLGPVQFPDAIAGGDVGLPALSHTGRFLAFGGRLQDRPSDPDLFVYDRDKKALLDTPGLNSPEKEEFSSISVDGRFLLFESLRSGNWDLFLYDLQRKELVELPGLNTASKERHPAISRE